MIAPQRLPSPASVRVGRLSSLLFHFRAADLDVTQALSGQLLTFARASANAWVRDANGLFYQVPSGMARLKMMDMDGDGVLETPGFVNELARTNLVLQSNDLSNASWAKTRASAVQVAGMAPDGGAISLLKEDATASNSHFSSQSVTITAGNYFTIQAFVVAKERFRGDFHAINAGNQIGTAFRLDTLALSDSLAGTGANTDKGIEFIGNGPLGAVYRIWVSGKLDGSSASATVVCQLTDSNGNGSYNGDGASGMYWWNVNLQQGTSLGSRIESAIPTTTTTTTRAVEQLSGTMAWAFQPNLTIYAKAQAPLWKGATGAIDSNAYFCKLGATPPYLAMALSSGRLPEAFFDDGGGTSGHMATAAALTSASPQLLEICGQFKNITTAPQAAVDAGTGLSAFAGAGVPIPALGSSALFVGSDGSSQGYGAGLIALKVAAGLRSLAEMQRMF